MKRTDLIAEIEANENGRMIHFKEFMISRDITKISDDEYDIDDCSCGWMTATVNKEMLIKLIMHEEEWYNLDWK